MEISLYIINHSCHYELENLCRVFFPNDKISVLRTDNSEKIKPYIYTKLSNGVAYVKACFEDFSKEDKKATLDESECELAFAHLLFSILKEYTGITPPWGILTGVRPIKLFRKLSETKGKEYTEKYFKDELYVTDKKIHLSGITEEYERKIIELSTKKSFSLYISIPFCPTRCSYCSFVSQSIHQAKKLISPYVELLCREIEYTGKIVQKLNLKLESVYIGGGTPTTLDEKQLALIISSVYNSFDMSTCREFTVEAGRPDTITYEKLAAIKNGGADRISINPQTMNDIILESIGRKHSAQQTIDAFKIATDIGFDSINTDLIAGLPSESFESFKNTLDIITDLNPENITVHTLSMKRSSYLTSDGLKLFREDSQRCEKMIDYSIEKLTSLNYYPYYLYRQSRMVGNLENTGWARDKKECLYNVFIMDETHTILACGAGAVTKLRQPGENLIERVFNFKYPYEYIDRFDELISRKERIGEFYDEHIR